MTSETEEIQALASRKGLRARFAQLVEEHSLKLKQNETPVSDNLAKNQRLGLFRDALKAIKGLSNGRKQEGEVVTLELPAGNLKEVLEQALRYFQSVFGTIKAEQSNWLSDPSQTDRIKKLVDNENLVMREALATLLEKIAVIEAIFQIQANRLNESEAYKLDAAVGKLGQLVNSIFGFVGQLGTFASVLYGLNIRPATSQGAPNLNGSNYPGVLPQNSQPPREILAKCSSAMESIRLTDFENWVQLADSIHAQNKNNLDYIAAKNAIYLSYCDQYGIQVASAKKFDGSKLAEIDKIMDLQAHEQIDTSSASQGADLPHATHASSVDNKKSSSSGDKNTTSSIKDPDVAPTSAPDNKNKLPTSPEKVFAVTSSVLTSEEREGLYRNSGVDSEETAFSTTYGIVVDTKTGKSSVPGLVVGKNTEFSKLLAGMDKQIIRFGNFDQLKHSLVLIVAVNTNDEGVMKASLVIDPQAPFNYKNANNYLLQPHSLFDASFSDNKPHYMELTKKDVEMGNQTTMILVTQALLDTLDFANQFPDIQPPNPGEYIMAKINRDAEFLSIITQDISVPFSKDGKFYDSNTGDFTYKPDQNNKKVLGGPTQSVSSTEQPKFFDTKQRGVEYKGPDIAKINVDTGFVSYADGTKVSIVGKGEVERVAGISSVTKLGLQPMQSDGNYYFVGIFDGWKNVPSTDNSGKLTFAIPNMVLSASDENGRIYYAGFTSSPNGYFIGEEVSTGGGSSVSKDMVVQDFPSNSTLKRGYLVAVRVNPNAFIGYPAQSPLQEALQKVAITKNAIDVLMAAKNTAETPETGARLYSGLFAVPKEVVVSPSK
jgi:hypothetical protein